MKLKSKFVSTIIILQLLALLSAFNTAVADEKQRMVTIPIEPELNAWKVKGPSSMSKWEPSIAEFDPKTPKTLKALTSNGQPFELVNKASGSLDIYTRQSFGDCTIEIEVMVPEKSNSGIYVMGQYEVQVKDSYGKSMFLNAGDMGGIVGTSKPKTNASAKPGQWQKYVIEFRAARFENGKRIAPAEFVKVVLNDKIVQEHVRMENGPTSGALRDGEYPTGPLMLQGGLGSIAYRNIRVLLPKNQ